MDRRSRFAVASLTVLVAIAPFDLAVPEEGVTDLAIRPLMSVAYLLAFLSLALCPPSRRAVVGAGAGLGLLWLVTLLSEAPVASAAASVRVTLAVVVLVAATSAFTDLSSIATVRVGLSLTIAVSSVIGLAALIVGGDLAITTYFLGEPSVSNGVDRLTRPFSHANVAAMFLGPSIALLAAGTAQAPSMSRGMSLVRLFAVGVGTLALSLTLSLGGLIATIIGLIAAAWWSRSAERTLDRILPLLCAAYLSASRAVYPQWVQRVEVTSGREDVALRPMSRPEIWEQAWAAFRSDPFLGVGPGLFGRFSNFNTQEGIAAAPHAHNLLLEALATGGLLLGLPLFALGAWLVVSVWRVASVEAGIGAALIVLAAHSVVDYGLVFTSTGIIFGLIGGAAIALGRVPLKDAELV